MTVAVVSWEVRPTATWDEYESRLLSVLNECADADLIVLPECVMLDLCGAAMQESPRAQVSRLAQLSSRYLTMLDLFAQNSGAIIVGGTHFDSVDQGVTHCTSLHRPDQPTVIQPKNVLTQFEIEDWGIVPATGLASTFPADLGVLVCYDSEFPEAGRAWAERGCRLLVVPAFTETEHGFNRVRTGCLARALENQMLVVHASLVGGLGAEPVPSTYGCSAIYGPMIPPFPPTGIVAESPLNQAHILKVDVNLDQVDQARTTGDVRNWEDRHRSEWDFS